MRNLFDQYEGPENRLTHALVSCLNEDRKLLRFFVRWVTGSRSPSGRRLTVIEQSLPGELNLSEPKPGERGLPDACIHDDDDWALIIESKVAAPVDAAELHRHRKTIERRGFEDIYKLVVSPEVPPTRSLAGWRHRTWPEVYEWFRSHSSQSDWARRMVDYMEVAEGRLTGEGYLDRGSLTMFSGIRFDKDNPYSYREAKRVLRLAMQELRKDKRLQRLGVDPSGEGRPAITEGEHSHVWDLLPLKWARGPEAFSKYPHLTLSIDPQRVLVITIIPHGVMTVFRRNLVALGKQGFRELVVQVAAELSKLLRGAKGAQPWLLASQRHYRFRRQRTIDAELGFDLRTAVPADHRRARGDLVKYQPEWLDVTYDVLANKRSNYLIAIGARFAHDCKALHTRAALDYFAGTWLACKPIMKALGVFVPAH